MLRLVREKCNHSEAMPCETNGSPDGWQPSNRLRGNAVGCVDWLLCLLAMDQMGRFPDVRYGSTVAGATVAGLAVARSAGLDVRPDFLCNARRCGEFLRPAGIAAQ